MAEVTLAELFALRNKDCRIRCHTKGTDTIGRPGQRSALRLLNAQHGVSCCVLSSAASTAGAEFPLMKLTVVLYSAELGC